MRLMSETTSPTLERRVSAKRSRTKPIRCSGARLRLLRTPQIISAPPTRPGATELIGPSTFTPRKAWPASGGVESRVRDATSSGWRTANSWATVPEKE